MRVRGAAATDIGLVRDGNEDSYLVEDPLFAVADGMGGHRGGEVASRLALETLQTQFRRGAGDLAEQVQEANRAVFEESLRNRRVAGMGTTLTAALVEGEHVRLAHVGDSRAYLLRGGELRRLTEDHTLVQRMVQEGEITQEEARVHPHRNVMTRAVGVDMTVDVDDRSVEVHAGDRLLLCTDGLTGMISEQRIGGILVDARDPQEAAHHLVDAANEAGGIDNITVVVLDFAQDDEEGATSHADGPAPALAPQNPPPRRPAAPRSWVGGGLATGAGPPARRRGRSARRAAVWAGAVVAVVVVGLVGLRVYVDRQWYVGISDGRVAIYQGIPAEVAGFRLHHVVVETTIPSAVAESLEVWKDLGQGITTKDRESAEAVVEQIRQDVQTLQPKTSGP
jgi:protein phosphatase